MAAVEICKLCLEGKDLQDSHLIGGAIYRLIREQEGEDPIVMTPEIVLQTSRQVSDYVFCKDCEQKLSEGGEKYVTGLVACANEFPLLDKIKLALYTVEKTHLEVSGERIGIDMEKLAFYAVSVVWRAAVQIWKTIGQQTTSVVLPAADLENVRKYLLGEAPLPENVGVVVSVCTDRASQLHVTFPTMLEHPTTYQDYWFLVLGIRFNVMVGLKGAKVNFSKVCCARSAGRKNPHQNVGLITTASLNPGIPPVVGAGANGGLQVSWTKSQNITGVTGNAFDVSVGGGPISLDAAFGETVTVNFTGGWGTPTGWAAGGSSSLAGTKLWTSTNCQGTLIP